jgi:hypothetical protein
MLTSVFIREAKLGKTILLPLPTRSIVNVLLESGVNLEMRSWERVDYGETTPITATCDPVHLAWR